MFLFVEFSILFEYHELLSVAQWKYRCLVIDAIKNYSVYSLKFSLLHFGGPDHPCMTRARDFYTAICEYLNI